MSDSINEQRCERNGLPISGCVASEYDCAKFGVCAAGPSVVTPPAQDEHGPVAELVGLRTEVDQLRDGAGHIMAGRDAAIDNHERAEAKVAALQDRIDAVRALANEAALGEDVVTVESLVAALGVDPQTEPPEKEHHA